MNYFKKYFFLLSILIFLNSCGGGWSNFKKTMTGEKVTNTDEFLIKKKDPSEYIQKLRFHDSIEKFEEYL